MWAVQVQKETMSSCTRQHRARYSREIVTFLSLRYTMANSFKNAFFTCCAVSLASGQIDLLLIPHFRYHTLWYCHNPSVMIKESHISFISSLQNYSGWQCPILKKIGTRFKLYIQLTFLAVYIHYSKEWNIWRTNSRLSAEHWRTPSRKDPLPAASMKIFPEITIHVLFTIKCGARDREKHSPWCMRYTGDKSSHWVRTVPC